MFQQQFQWANHQQSSTTSVGIGLSPVTLAVYLYQHILKTVGLIEWEGKKKKEQNRNPNTFLVTTKFEWKVIMLPVIH